MAVASDTPEQQRGEMQADRWRLWIYTAAFLIAFLLYLLVYGRALPVLGPGVLAAAAVGFGAMRRSGPWLRFGVLAALFIALAFPLLEESALGTEPLVEVIGRSTIWPQLVVTLMASRVLASECDLSFVEFWRSDRLTGAVELQSLPAAVALGAFLTLVFYLAIPHMVSSSTRGHPAMIIVSALQGGTIVHTTIVFLFFVIMAAVGDATRLYLADRAALARFREAVKRTRASGALVTPARIISQQLSALSHTRTARLLSEAAASATGTRGGFDSLSALSFSSFHDASRRFIRTLLPFLPLLGFLGTVIGLATAIAELPASLSDVPGRSFDISGSLAGLAIKFETTLLGLLASMTAALALNLLEKRETELSAECLRSIEAALAPPDDENA
jgi:biopolymer transport protein ExbB/TolQ